jgi:hypothetical protein
MTFNRTTTASPTLGDRAMVLVEDEPYYATKVLERDLEAFKRQAAATRGDVRLLGDHHDAARKPHLSLNDAVGMLTEAAMADWFFGRSQSHPRLLASGADRTRESHFLSC